MKKKMILALTAVLLLGFIQIGYAKYVSGFRVVNVTDGKVVIRNGEAKPITVTTRKGRFAVGNKVMYDAVKKKVRVQPEGC